MAVKTVPYKDKSALGQRLKKTRKDTGLSTVEMATQIGASHTAIGNWEKGNSEPPLAYLAYLAENYACDLNWLLLGTDLLKSEDQNKVALSKENTELLRENRALRKENDLLKKGSATGFPISAVALAPGEESAKK